MNAIHKVLESWQLLQIELMNFDGNPGQWPESIADFKEGEKKQTFSDQLRMERLLSAPRGDTEWSVESISKSKIFHAAALKLLKQDFRNAFYGSYIKLSELWQATN